MNGNLNAKIFHSLQGQALLLGAHLGSIGYRLRRARLDNRELDTLKKDLCEIQRHADQIERLLRYKEETEAIDLRHRRSGGFVCPSCGHDGTIARHVDQPNPDLIRITFDCLGCFTAIPLELRTGNHSTDAAWARESEWYCAFPDEPHPWEHTDDEDGEPGDFIPRQDDFSDL